MMRIRLFLSLAFLFLVANSAFAYPQTSVGAIHAFVTEASGNLRIYSSHWSTGLLVSVQIDDRIYTNNGAATGARRFAPAIMGQLHDTVALRWTTPDSVDVDLRCYPYDKDLIVSVGFTNHSPVDHACAAQVLQSYSVAETTAPYLGTDRDYSNLAREIPAKGQSGKPRLFVLAKSDIGVGPNTTGWHTGAMFSGTGLPFLGPSHLYFGVWSALAVTAFGPPTQLPTGCDGGLLLVWDPVMVAPDATAPICLWSLTDDVYCCSSSDVVLLSMSTAVPPFYTHKLNITSTAYSIDQRGVTDPRVVLNVTPSFKILSHHFGGDNVDTLPLAATLIKGTAQVADWQLLNVGSLSAAADATLSVLGSNLNPVYRDGCGFDFQSPKATTLLDFRKPFVTNQSSVSSVGNAPCNTNQYAITVRDTESGIDHATLTGWNFALTAGPYIPGTDSVTFALTVIDTLINGKAEIDIYDRAGNTTILTYNYCSVEDVLPPEVRIEPMKDSSIAVLLERRAWDRGLASFNITTSINATLDSSTLYLSQDSIRFVIRKTDPALDASFCLTATDLAHNTSTVTCWNTAEGRVAGEDSTPLIIDLVFDPDSRRLHVGAMDGQYTCDVYDILGRLQLHNYDHSIDLSGLTAGTYIVRAIGGGAAAVKRIRVR
jgi:hypothetical protein